MISHRAQGNMLLALFTILAVTCALILLAACGTMVEPEIAPAAVVLTDTPVQPTYTPNGKELFGTHVAMTEEAMGTSVALTGVPTWTPGRPPAYPTSTPNLGLSQGACSVKNSLEPFFINCWVGIIDGDYIDVEVGREGRLGDRQQGVIMVVNISARHTEIYQTPQRAGPMRIVAIDGTRFTLAPIDFYYFETPEALQTPWTTATPGAVFIFDIATRQWVFSPLTPVPTVTNLP